MATGILTQMRPPKPTWSTDEIPDLSGKVAIVTGGSGGIGKETAKVLLSKGATVYIAARSQKKAEEAIKDIKETTGHEGHFLKLDLGDLPSVKAAVAEFQSKETKLDMLFNSGGVMFPPLDDTTPSGYDLQFGTNVVGHFYLTKLLIPSLIAGAKASPDGKSRVINTSSQGHQFAPGSGLNFDTFKDGPARKKLSSVNLYSQSKFANIIFSNEMARRYGDQGIVSIALHPGNIKTDLDRHQGKCQKALTGWMLYPIPLGALTQLYAGTSPEGANLNGQYLIPWARVGKPHPGTGNKEMGEKLWQWLEDEVKHL